MLLGGGGGIYPEVDQWWAVGCLSLHHHFGVWVQQVRAPSLLARRSFDTLWKVLMWPCHKHSNHCRMQCWFVKWVLMQRKAPIGKMRLPSSMWAVTLAWDCFLRSGKSCIGWSVFGKMLHHCTTKCESCNKTICTMTFWPVSSCGGLNGFLLSQCSPQWPPACLSSKCACQPNKSQKRAHFDPFFHFIAFLMAANFLTTWHQWCCVSSPAWQTNVTFDQNLVFQWSRKDDDRCALPAGRWFWNSCTTCATSFNTGYHMIFVVAEKDSAFNSKHFNASFFDGNRFRRQMIPSMMFQWFAPKKMRSQWLL